MTPARMLPDRREERLTIGVITHLSLLAAVPAEEVARLARSSWNVRARRGELIVKRHTHLPGIFALAYGTVKLVLCGGDSDGRLLRLVAAGQTFGEPSALLGHAVDYEVRAVGECKLVVMPTGVVLEIADRHPRFARDVTLAVARRAVEALAELQAATLQRSDQRLAAYLRALAGHAPAADGPTRIELPVSKTTLASRIGVKKETLSRLLRQFATEGLIEVARREVAILDPVRLAARTQS